MPAAGSTANIATPGRRSACDRYLAPDATGKGTREDRDRLLAEADIILGSWPFPLDLRARAPRLKWFHQRPAGASNLLRGDLWGSDVTVTTSRGSANALAIAEYAVAGILHIAKGLHRAAVDRDAGAFNARAYRPLLLEGKTVCVVGAGGIGVEVGRLCAALGMRVVGTRRHRSPISPAARVLRNRRCRATSTGSCRTAISWSICCQWTPETDRLFNQDRFAAMKPAASSSMSRGGRSSMRTRSRMRWHAITCAAPCSMSTSANSSARRWRRLWSDPRVLITPHISAASDQDRHGGIELFCDNLRAWLDGRPMRNVIDWERGY